METSDIVKPV